MSRQIDTMTPQEIETLALKGMTAPRTPVEQGEIRDTISHLLKHAQDDMRLAELTASRASLWDLAEACRIAHGEILKSFVQL